MQDSSVMGHVLMISVQGKIRSGIITTAKYMSEPLPEKSWCSATALRSFDVQEIAVGWDET